jgi:hypothetical protein
VFVRATEKTERTERVCTISPPLSTLCPFLERSVFSVLSVFSVFSALSACARIEPPPGGPPDPAPPRLIATRPDSFERLSEFKGVAEFHFDEVVSEGGAPNRGEGTGGLEKLVILSPSNRVPEVDWRRNRITVRPREGWQRNRVYRVELLPGVTDLRSNRSDQGAVITFSTGAPRPQATLDGRVIDWSTSRPVPGALVIASLLPDSLHYRGVADSSGRFSLGPLPRGEYSVSGVVDQDADHQQDPREAYGSAGVAAGKTSVGELWAFVHDTLPPRIQTVTVDDSVKATITFSQKLDPRQRLAARDVTLRLLPDSTPVALSSILPQPLDDSLHARKTPAPADSAMKDSVARPDTGAARRNVPRPRARGVIDEPKLSRPPLYDRLVLRVPRPWAPGSRLVLEVRGVRNVSGVAGTATGVLAVPETPKKDSTATVRGKPARPGARGRTPADSIARPPRDTVPPKPRPPVSDPRKK